MSAVEQLAHRFGSTLDHLVSGEATALLGAFVVSCSHPDRAVGKVFETFTCNIFGLCDVHARDVEVQSRANHSGCASDTENELDDVNAVRLEFEPQAFGEDAPECLGRRVDALVLGAHESGQ